MSKSKGVSKSQNLFRISLIFALLFVPSLQAINLSQAADVVKRIPRSIDEIPRPSELRLGLSQIQYKGYFGRDSRWFSDARYNASVMQNLTTPSSGPQSIESSQTPTPVSYSWTGYFISDATGDWQFRISADDAAFLWIGNDAVSNYQSIQSAPFLDASWPNKVTVSKKISLVRNKIYPLRIQYGNSGGPATFKFSFLAPGQTSWMSNFDNLLWRSPELVGDCTNFGMSYTLGAELGFDSDIPAVCNSDGTSKFSRSWIMVKPDSPQYKSVRVVNSEFLISVTLGDIKVSSIYLTSPKIGYTNSSRLAGKIAGKSATFSIPLSKLKSASTIDLSFISANDQGATTTSVKAVKIPLQKGSPPVTANPTPAKTNTESKSILCSKGDKSRTFEGKLCPPGWSK